MQHFNNLRIGIKLVIGFSVMILFMALIGAAGYKSIRNVNQYLDEILNSNLYAADYIDMINEVRSKENYLFSHSCAVAFYALAIAKKLKFLKEDSENKNFGRWVPIKTKKNRMVGGPLPMSNQLLRYIDHQKNIIIVKFSDEIREILFDDVHDLIHSSLLQRS